MTFPDSAPTLDLPPSDQLTAAGLQPIVRAWIDAYVPAAWLAAARAGDLVRLHEVRTAAAYREWYPALGASGLVAPSWPREFGGLGLPEGDLTRLIADELRENRLVLLNVMGLALAGPLLLGHGSPDQQRRMLPKILTNQEVWSQLFSEPGAGSDLAGLATRASQQTDGSWRITGSKVWTSFAADARRGLLAARTDPTLPKHAGLTLFVLDMADPGVEVRPLRKIDGEREFSEVVIDNAAVPDADRIGAVGDGWKLMRAVLAFEKALLAGRGSGARERSSGRSISSVLTLARQLGSGAGSVAMRRELANLWLESESIRQVSARATRRRSAGRDTIDPSAQKILQSEHNQRLQLAAARLLGDRLEGHDLDDATANQIIGGFLRSRGDTIGGGTSEIHRNQVAERALGLPREPSDDRAIPWRDIPRGREGKRPAGVQPDSQ